ncbi:MAG: hypothetical protein E7087_00635 [Bacteroidales bacterium]|nr:hypothetical protein [Bacteroidales bacterium]
MSQKNIIFYLLIIIAIILFQACSDEDFNEFEDSKYYSLSSRILTRSSLESSANDESEEEIKYPNHKTIREAIEADMTNVWKEALAACDSTGRYEYGFYIYYNPINKEIFKGETIISNKFPNNSDVRAEIEMGDNEPDTEERRVCGFFHTHTPLTYFKEEAKRKVGPSEDADEPFAKRIGVPGFVYDYSNLIEDGHDINDEAKIYNFGPSRRK